jgi:molybdopterin synthase sulfur carrier subunit
MLNLLYFATIRELTGEKGSTMEEDASTARALLGALADRYGRKFREYCLEGEEISDRVIVLVNGRHIAHSGGGDTPLSGGDTVSIFPIVGGG